MVTFQRKNAGCVYNLQYHLVWCQKYRKSVLVGPVETALKQLLEEKATALEVHIEALEVMPDHVHLFMSAPPTLAPAQLANQFKSYTSHVLRHQFPHLKSRLPTLWRRSNSIGSTGAVTAETVKGSIEEQKKRGE
jgi:putative transposase